MRVLTAADHRVMPWKNGLGTTTEIAVHPPGAGLDEFTWRVSIADLGASGPFSTFEGCERVIVQLEGAPMTLMHEGAPPRRLSLLAPHRFAGEVATHAALEAPPARDFNVMVRRDRASAEVVVHDLAAGGIARCAGGVSTRLLFVLRGAASVDVGGRERVLGEGETCLAAGGGPIAVTAGPAGAVILAVEITLGAAAAQSMFENGG